MGKTGLDHLKKQLTVLHRTSVSSNLFYTSTFANLPVALALSNIKERNQALRAKNTILRAKAQIRCSLDNFPVLKTCLIPSKICAVGKKRATFCKKGGSTDTG